MTDNQKRASALLGILFLLAVAAAMLWLAWLAGTSSYEIPAAAEDQKLNFSWRAVVFFMNLGAAVNTMFAVLLTVASAVGVAVSETYKRLPAILAISLLCLTGIVAATSILILVDDAGLNLLRYYGSVGLTTIEVGDRLKGFIAPIIGWLSLSLAAQLGISTVAPGGIVRKIIEN